MGTYIVLNNKDRKEWAIFDYRPGEFTNSFYSCIRDMEVVHNCQHRQIKYLGTQVTVDEWITKYGVPACLERFFPEGHSYVIPF